MLSWSFSSRHDHSASWYIIAIVVVLMLVVYGIVQGLYLMSVVSFLFAGVYLLMENNSTPTTAVEITDAGIQVGGSFYGYTQFARFSIVSIADTPAFVRLYPNKRLSPIIDIPFAGGVDIGDLRAYLSSHIEEEKNNTLSNADALIHAMKL
jgi:hypothetical protein